MQRKFVENVVGNGGTTFLKTFRRTRVRARIPNPFDFGLLHFRLPTFHFPLLTNYSWRIGKIFGVPTDLHWTFLLVPVAILYFAWSPESGMNWTAVGWWGLVAFLLFTFVLIHELGHALVARDRGVVAERIILFPLGGGAYIPEQPKQLWAEVLVYAAGPLANILLALIAWIALIARPDGDLIVAFYLRLSGNLVVYPDLIDQLLGLSLSVNLLLALGNLLPAYPLDGGRILRALLRGPLGARPATVVVTALGVLIGSGLIYLGFVLGDPLLGAGALFVIGLSVMEFRNGWQRRRLAKKSLSAVLRPIPNVPPPPLYLTDRVGEARARFTATGWPILPVFDQWNEQVGFLDPEVLDEEAASNEDRLLAFCEPEFVTARPTETLLAVTERIVAANVYGATVYDEAGAVAGYVFTEDVLRVLKVRSK